MNYTPPHSRVLADLFCWLTQGIDYDSLTYEEKDTIRYEFYYYTRDNKKDINRLYRRLKDTVPYSQLDHFIEASIVWSFAGVQPVQVEVQEEGVEDRSYNIVGKTGSYIVVFSFPDEETAREAQYRGEDINDVMHVAKQGWRADDGMEYRADTKDWFPVMIRYRLALPIGMKTPLLKI